MSSRAGPRDYEIPGFVRSLVARGSLEEMPFDEGCPSFSVMIRDCRGKRLWLQVWVEHANPVHRRFWAHRFTALVQPDVMILFGRRVVSTDHEGDARRRIIELMEGRIKRFRQDRFKILPSGGV